MMFDPSQFRLNPAFSRRRVQVEGSAFKTEDQPMCRPIRVRMTLTLGALAATLLFAPLDVAAQGGSITGLVTDGQTGQPVAAAQVFIA